MSPDDEARLMSEYERLRKRLHELNVQAEYIDRRLVQIERQLPDHFPSPDASPVDDIPERPTWPHIRWDDAE